MSNTETVALHRPNYFLEFVVVFLGVTISFWLSQWNEERKTAALHKEDVVSLLEDLDRDRIRLEYVFESAERGKSRSRRALAVTEAYRRGELGYGAFADSLIDIGYLYGYGTFFMNSATYKSLLGSDRMQEFPHDINKQVRDYYEYVSKRVEDNNDIVDAIALRYYNEYHPFCLIINGGAEPLSQEASRRFFADADTQSHYSSLGFYHQTIALHDRTGVHMDQVEQYQEIRDALEQMLLNYAEELLGEPLTLDSGEAADA